MQSIISHNFPAELTDGWGQLPVQSGNQDAHVWLTALKTMQPLESDCCCTQKTLEALLQWLPVRKLRPGLSGNTRKRSTQGACSVGLGKIYITGTTDRRKIWKRLFKSIVYKSKRRHCIKSRCYPWTVTDNKTSVLRTNGVGWGKAVSCLGLLDQRC